MAVQISGLCPSANKLPETDEFDDNASGFMTARGAGGNDSDGGGSMGKSSMFTSRKQKSKKKYQAKVELRSSSQEILDLLRSDFEGFISNLTVN